MPELKLEDIGLNLEPIDLRILALLAKDCRISYAEIAREVHLSRMAVRERVMRLISRGIIERFTVQINGNKAGINASLFLEVSAMPSKFESVAQKLAAHPRIESVYAMTGKNLLHVHAYLEDFSRIETFIFEDVYKIDGVTAVDFNLMTRRYKSTRLMT